jgi:hypothetical protein
MTSSRTLRPHANPAGEHRLRRMTTSHSLLAGMLLLLAGCAAGTPPPPPMLHAGLAPEQEAFWAALQAHCGNAYRGRVSDATAYYAGSVQGDAVIHFMECDAERIHIPFHLSGNRSRNWILTKAGGTLRLKHDHRHEDGREEAISQYGGDAPAPGLPHRQIFPADAHTAAILPERADNFWFFHFVDEGTLHYGVHWPKHGHSVRFEFDLTTPVAVPPRPWGY